MAMHKPKVLVCGGGIAGSVLAYWLGKYGFNVLVIERASSQAQAQQGQIVDVEGPAREVVERMGLLDAIKDEATNEAGLQFIDSSGRIFGTLVSGTTSISNEIEIQRPALTRVLCRSVDGFENVEVRYDTTVRSLRQTADRVYVELVNRSNDGVQQEEFDILVACDGLRSRTRDMILDPSERQNAVRSVGMYSAFFSIPAEEQDRPYWKILTLPGRKQLSLKPLTHQETSAYANIFKASPELRQARENRDVQQQKRLIAEAFEHAGWESERVLKGMMATENFYFEEISQVFLDKWSKNRCVLVGDTAYCPSPLTGQGTNLAFVGAYVLAANLVKHPNDCGKAFKQYEEEFRPYVNKTQPLLLGGKVLYAALPLTIVGVWLQRIVAWIFLSLKVYTLFPDINTVPYDLPDLR